MTLARTLFESTPYLRRKRDLLLSIQKAQKEMTGIKKGTSPQSLERLAQESADIRGRALYYPALFSGLGRGPLVELVDGSIKYDFITGIGTHYFGHSDLDLISTALEAASQDVIMQGNLQMGLEGQSFLKDLLSMAGAPLKYGWLACSGSFANDNALKIIRSKKTPA